MPQHVQPEGFAHLVVRSPQDSKRYFRGLAAMCQTLVVGIVVRLQILHVHEVCLRSIQWYHRQKN